MDSRTQSLWHATHHIRHFAPLSRALAADVIVIGGGITGLTAAVLLARVGRSVVVLEQDRLGGGETGHTTSHLTEAVDGRYQTVRRDFGEQGARLVAQSSRDAIDRIAAFVRENAIECGFERVPGYLYAEREQDVAWLARELDAASHAGCEVEWVDHAPLPFPTAGAICWPRQAQLHATAYLAGLVEEAAARGVRIHEQTRATNVHDARRGGDCLVHTDRFDLTARDVVVAANVPINNRVFLHTKIAAYRSYAVACEAGTESVPAGLFWDTDDPYHYTRLERAAGQTYLIVGGEDHRTGEQADTEACFAKLAQYVEQRFGARTVRYRWSGQIIEPVDGLPFIGLNTGSEHVYVATGYSGNGMTFGTLAGMITSDLIAGRDNPYAGLYAATRIKPLASAVDYVMENAAFPVHLAVDRLTSLDTDSRSIEQLQPGEGAIFEGEGGEGGGGKVAVCRDHRGGLHACSAVCTHLGCDVAWNRAEQTWDCPCHGSRFSPEGKVLNGPAVSDLKPLRIPVRTR